MSSFTEICVICLKHSYNLTIINSEDLNGTSFEDKLKYFLPELELNSNIPKHICAKCRGNLNKSYEFKQKCLKNITSYEKYAQQITTTDSSHKYLSVDFMDKQVISEEHNYHKISVDIVKNEEIFIKDEINDELCESEEKNVELDNTYIKIENIVIDNVQIPIGNEDNATQNECDRKLHKCKKCNKLFKFMSGLRKHKKNHNKTKYVCDFCNESCKHPTDLRDHKRRHTGEKPFPCEVCNKAFYTRGNLKSHMIMHTTEKSFTCEVCNKSFRHPQSLKQHKLIHTDEKPHICKFCNKSFRLSTNLTFHQQKHTGKKPFGCEVCNRSFNAKQHLRRHIMNSHFNNKFEFVA